MHIPLIGSLASHLLPFLASPPDSTASQSGNSLTFHPVLAHAHASASNSSSSTNPQLWFHNATSPTSFLSIPSFSSLASEDEALLLDYPAPHLAAQPLSIRTTPMIIRRPRIKPPSILSWSHSARWKRTHPDVFPFPTNSIAGDGTTWMAPNYDDDRGGWEDVEIQGPDVTDRQTLITLAKMMSNAYVLPDGGEWWPVGEWNATLPFGWESDADGLRGHVFADPTNSTVIISIKGTSAGVLGSGGPTAKNDKFNDNLLFSCCCARVDFSWSPVCDCWAGGYKCERTCLEDAVVTESVYATVGTNLYNNVTFMYPDATIWLVGHSLGGSISALVGLSFGAPVVTIEAPGDKLPASRLHLPLPPGLPAEKTGITHIYHTADPIPMGACTGAYSGCYAAGFAMESVCHTGRTILYDTVTVKGWSVDVRTHRIGEIINKVLADPWPVEDDDEDDETEVSLLSWWGWGRKGPKRHKGGSGDDEDDDDDDGWQKHGGVPRAVAESNCTDCFRWEYGDGWDKKLAD